MKVRLTRRQAFAVAAVIAVIVAGLVYFVLSQQTRPPEPQQAEKVTVLVAKTQIPQYSTITAEMLGTKQMDTRAAPSGALTQPEQAIGKIAHTAMVEGQTITSGEIGARSARQGLTFVIPEGMRAVTVALDPISGVGGFVYPGDSVDVLATFQQGEVAVTKTILQNVEVLAMNELTRRPVDGGRTPQVTDQTQTGQDATDGEEGQPETIQVKSATLAVAPDEAQSLLLSAFKGAVHLALRPRESEAVVSLPGQTDWALMGMQPPSEEAPEEPESAQPQAMPNGWPAAYGPPQQPGAQAPGQPAAQPQAEQQPAPSVEVFRGGQREVVTLD